MHTHRTIFLTLSNFAVFRNFFMDGEGVFGHMRVEARKRNIRIGVIVPGSDYQKYVGYFGGADHEDFFIRPVSVPYPSTFLGKLFRFAYSYLVYTDTTRIIATMGMRPDEPAAGGKWYLGPVKELISKTFGRSDWVKLRLVPWLFYRIYRERPYAHLYDIYRPAFVFSAHLYGWHDAFFLAEAKRRGVYTYGMTANWDHVDKYYLPFHVDTLFAQSEEVADAALRYQRYSPEDIVLTGYPYFDFFSRRDTIISREETMRSINLPGDARYLLYVSGSTYCPDEPDIIGEILSWLERGDFGPNTYLVIRPYNGGRTADREFDHKKYESFRTHPLVRFYDRESWATFDDAIRFLNILRYCHQMLSVYSTVALEAAVLDRPILAVAFDGHQKRPFHRSIARLQGFEHFKNIKRTGAMPTAHNFEELHSIVAAYFLDGELHRKEREDMRAYSCYRLDGKASNRIVERLFMEQ